MTTVSDIMLIINECISLLSKDGINGKAQARAKLMTAYNALGDILDKCIIDYPDDDFMDFLCPGIEDEEDE